VAETSTTERLARLVEAQVLDPDLARDLTDALQLLMALKLKAGLAEMDRGDAVSGAVDPSALSPLERDLLKDALGVVKRFKTLLRQRFRLNAL
jgi:CBS domain-containing protein